MRLGFAQTALRCIVSFCSIAVLVGFLVDVAEREFLNAFDSGRRGWRLLLAVRVSIHFSGHFFMHGLALRMILQLCVTFAMVVLQFVHVSAGRTGAGDTIPCHHMR